MNAHDADPGYPPTVISTRSLDSPLYEIDSVLRAMAVVRRRLQMAQLLVAGSGRLQPALHKLAQDLGLGESVRFLGFLDDEALRSAFASAHVYVSVPRSDATAVSTLSAMAAGCFPVVSDLPTQQEWIEDGVNGFRVPAGDVATLAQRLGDALDNARPAPGRRVPQPPSDRGARPLGELRPPDGDLVPAAGGERSATTFHRIA